MRKVANPRRLSIDVLEAQNSEERYRPYRGRRIREVRVYVLPPFGTSVRDSVFIQDSLSWVLAVANSLHQSSSERILRRQMTVEPGMEVDPFELVQNEQLLKELDIVDDALIMVKPVEGEGEGVDLVVVCKDEFSWTGEVWSNFLNAFDVGIGSQNLLRRGHTVEYELRYRGRREQQWGNVVDYNVRNVFDTRFHFRGLYENTYQQELFRVEVERPFLTYKSRWAGGAALSRVYSSRTLVDRDITKPVRLFDYRLGDFWAGWSAALPERYSYNQNVYVTGRFTVTDFVHRPEVTSDTNHYYYDRRSAVVGVTYNKVKYFRANLIYDFGRTEDIPSGLSGTLLAGYERSEFSKYAYLGTEWYYAWFDRERERYYACYAALGGFWNGEAAESCVAKVGGDYISRLYPVGRHRLRFYSGVDYIHGFKRNPDDYIYFEDGDIRGFDTDTIRGTQRLSGSVAATLFLPSITRGFRASVSAFVDAGALAPARKNVLRVQTYWGLGFSLNLRNDNLIFKNISLRFTFYPNTPPGFHAAEVDVSSSRESGFRDFRVGKPSTILYE